MSTSKRAVARRRGRAITPNGVPVTKARVLKSRMRGNSHVRFGSGGGAGDRPTDRNHLTPLLATSKGLLVEYYNS